MLDDETVLSESCADSCADASCRLPMQLDGDDVLIIDHQSRRLIPRRDSSKTLD